LDEIWINGVSIANESKPMTCKQARANSKCCVLWQFAEFAW